MRFLTLVVLLAGCGTRTLDPEPSPAPNACGPASVVKDERIAINLVDPTAADRWQDSCESGREITITNFDAKCTVSSGPIATLCDGHGVMPLRPAALLLEGNGILPTLTQKLGHLDAPGVTYVLPAVQESFLRYLPSFDGEHTAALVAARQPDCPQHGVVITVDAPGAVVRYVGDGSATNETGLATIEGLPPGPAVVRARSACGTGAVAIELHRGAVFVTSVQVK